MRTLCLVAVLLGPICWTNTVLPTNAFLAEVHNPLTKAKPFIKVISKKSWVRLSAAEVDSHEDKIIKISEAVRAFAGAGAWAKALAVLAQARRAGAAPRPAAYAAAAAACRRAGEVDRASAVLEDWRKVAAAAPLPTADSVVSETEAPLHRAFKVLEVMQNSPGPEGAPDTETVNLLLAHCEAAGDWAAALAAHERLLPPLPAAAAGGEGEAAAAVARRAVAALAAAGGAPGACAPLLFAALVREGRLWWPRLGGGGPAEQQGLDLSGMDGALARAVLGAALQEAVRAGAAGGGGGGAPFSADRPLLVQVMSEAEVAEMAGSTYLPRVQALADFLSGELGVTGVRPAPGGAVGSLEVPASALAGLSLAGLGAGIVI